MSELGTYYDALGLVHETLEPATYLEIGVHEGHSLGLVRPGTSIVAVDPEPKVASAPDGAVIVEATSDELFASSLPSELLPEGVDVAFVDGLHLFEQALRDVINVERNSHDRTVLLLHDCLPIDEATSARERTGVVWSGDVWKVVVALRRHRPDLDVRTLDVAPTGLAVVTGLDPADAVLDARFDDIVDELIGLSYADLVELGIDRTLAVVPGTRAELLQALVVARR